MLRFSGDLWCVNWCEVGFSTMGFGHWEIFTAPVGLEHHGAGAWELPKVDRARRLASWSRCLGYFGKCLESLNEFGFYFPALNALNLESLVFSTYCLIWIEIQQIKILPRASACSCLTFQCKPFIQPSASQPRSQIPPVMGLVCYVRIPRNIIPWELCLSM